MKLPPFIKGWIAGNLFTLFFISSYQDWYGGLEGYIKHLRQPGVWFSVPWWIWLFPMIFILIWGHKEINKERD